MQNLTGEIKNNIMGYLTSEIITSITELDDNAALIDGRLIDSIGIMKIISFIESKYNLSLEDNDMVMENFQTVNAICNMIERLMANTK